MKEMEIKPGQGIADISLGMSENQLISILGGDYERREHPGHNDSSTSTISITFEQITVTFDEDGSLSFIAIGKEMESAKLWNEYIFRTINESIDRMERTQELLKSRKLSFEVVSDSFGDMINAPAAGVTFCFHAIDGTLEAIQIAKIMHNQSFHKTPAIAPR